MYGKAAHAAYLFPEISVTETTCSKLIFPNKKIPDNVRNLQHISYFINFQEQVCYADRFPFLLITFHTASNQLTFTLSTQSHPSPRQPLTHPHNSEQLRAQKGGARGGKTGFATPSAFPLANSHTSKCPTCQGNHATRLNVPLWKRNQIYASVSSRN